MKTDQENFWSKNFGQEYSDRNSWQSDAEWDKFYFDNWGKSKLDINNIVLEGLPRDIRILEVGCNIGMQLRGFQRMGFENLYGIELQHYAVEKAKQINSKINIIQGSGFDLPFKDEFFDLVCTNGVLIHIAPADHSRIMKEMYRCSSKYIMGWEYYADDIQDINYRGNTGYLWKADFAGIFMKNFPGLKEVSRTKVPYISEKEKGNVDEIYLLTK
ncbi:pseudaminic acid biosynthesis-associated methylase [Dyadobacter fanqingshengii]|uniref:Methyltransferase domain-containing protein n=1 Tax=Dyadobacter fanqingshengii TaxID=2906443 RepID=A0A9X1PBP4_9BACT|nr:pseudaminic acid biosynthesis-associated methylase [Dyadobacter fanqingshengii]MCF0042234.1 methyltransferase domain-containing protein [Dyadobacter fanqingshengii]USJ35235.1 methyltransferase domain-containing protein [Dyadobacter fanqingshengii]